MEKSDEDEPLELQIDELGRVVNGGVDLSPLKLSFRSFRDVMSRSDPRLGTVCQDVRTVHSAKALGTEDELSAGSTYWLGASDRPQTLLEELVLGIFDFHTKTLRRHASFNADRSGAEWWTLDISGDADVGFHWDKDYAMEDAGLNVTPHISTVTYLSDAGAATIVTGFRAPRHYGDMSAFDEPVTSPYLHVSPPSVGKHISFDGRLLHAAPCDFAQKTLGLEAEESERRLSLLVNVWINHRPTYAEPLHPQLRRRVANLSEKPSGIVNFAGKEDSVPVLRLSDAPENSTREQLTCVLPQDGTNYAVDLNFPGVRMVEERESAIVSSRDWSYAVMHRRSFTFDCTNDPAALWVRPALEDEFSEEDEEETDDGEGDGLGHEDGNKEPGEGMDCQEDGKLTVAAMRSGNGL
uniref:Uncharacterized protein n=1 Tax=Pinguiococcus pyrenoidosus TaxID=172671 RepID=A0A7R9UBJ3_9STRA